MNAKINQQHQIRAFLKDDGDAAKNHLTAGRPIAYCDDEISLDYIIREWPGGLRELVSVDKEGNVTVIRTL